MNDAPFGLTAADAAALASSLRFDDRGLVPAIAQDALTGEVRMVAYMNREAFERTTATGEAHFYSRSRQTLWKKGESSGHTLAVQSVYLDCDGDCVLLAVEPAGPSCHTGAPSCFFRRLEAREASAPSWAEGARPLGMADRLEQALEARRAAPADRSYTRRLLDGGAALIGGKLREEADELARAMAGEDDARVASEAADVVYHLLVALVSRGVPWRAVLAELARRFGTGGLAEKAARAQKRDGG